VPQGFLTTQMPDANAHVRGEPFHLLACCSLQGRAIGSVLL
jgi:hypothetical protein